jgi:hypothetical protein
MSDSASVSGKVIVWDLEARIGFNDEEFVDIDDWDGVGATMSANGVQRLPLVAEGAASVGARKKQGIYEKDALCYLSRR